LNRTEEYLRSLVEELRALPKETGEYISSLSNTAALNGKSHAYMVWGIADESHEVVGTNFKPKHEKVGNEELESWLLRLLIPTHIFYVS
jgi:ATP-dependent DNA helicase RecG